MVRRSLLVDAGLEYSEEYRLAQDFELWSRCFRSLRFANIQEVLLRYRLHGHNRDAARQKKQAEFADKVRLRLIAELWRAGYRCRTAAAFRTFYMADSDGAPMP